jgi:type VI secretion system protein ImpB
MAMPKEGSVAPKERINIVYKSAIDGSQQEVELPLKLMMTGDYTLKSDDRPLEDRKPINVDKDNFNKVMREQNLELAISVPNRLSDEKSDEMPVSLRFETLKDFEPENVARQVSELNQLLELRQALTALKGPLGNLPAFRKKLQSILSDEGTREKLIKELEKKTDEAGEENTA